MKYSWKFNDNPINDYQLPESSHPILKVLLSKIEMKQENIESFLNPKLNYLHSPDKLSDIDKASEEIISTIEKGQKILIFGDFDVDGVVSTSILWQFLYRKLGANVIPIIPNRFDEGYGLTKESLTRVKEEKPALVITVDCGIRDIELIKSTPEIKFIITDHHTYPVDQKGEKLILEADNLVAVVHPQNPKFNYPFTEICGSTVAWKLVHYLAQKAGIIISPDEYIELVALSTITDVMPLLDENRVIVHQGLQKIRNTESISIKSLLKTADLKSSDIDTYHFGYVLGPRINAAGRMEDAMIAVRLFCTDSEKRADELATKLNNLNYERQKITQELLEIANEEMQKFENDNLAFIHGEDWPEGILGLIAGKLLEKYNKPVLVASINKETNSVKGSARSPKIFDITDALAVNKNLLSRFGGHVQAAGFSTTLENLSLLKSNLIEQANRKLNKRDLLPEIEITSELEINSINESLLNTIEIMSPFGMSNPRPLFLFKNLLVTGKKNIGSDGKHIKIMVTQDYPIEALGFNLAEEFSDVSIGDKIDLVGVVKFNEWRGNKKIQIDIKDFRKTSL